MLALTSAYTRAMLAAPPVLLRAILRLLKSAACCVNTAVVLFERASRSTPENLVGLRRAVPGAREAVRRMTRTIAKTLVIPALRARGKVLSERRLRVEGSCVDGGAGVVGAVCVPGFGCGP